MELLLKSQKCVCVFFLPHLETGSHEAQAGLKLAMQLRMTLSFCSPASMTSPNTGIIGTHRCASVTHSPPQLGRCQTECCQRMKPLPGPRNTQLCFLWARKHKCTPCEPDRGGFPPAASRTFQET